MSQSDAKRNGIYHSVESRYTPFLIEALNNIDESYYRILTTYDEIVRERVFCYEFYHQMRLIQNNYSLDKLHPEIDKRGHEMFKIEDQKNPDFIFHTPGQMEENNVVIEVKGKINRDILKDFETLDIFCKSYKYKVGYFILFGDCLKHLKIFFNRGNIINEIMKYSDATNITIFCKKDKRSEPEICKLSDLIESPTNVERTQ